MITNFDDFGDLANKVDSVVREHSNDIANNKEYEKAFFALLSAVKQIYDENELLKNA